MALSIIFGFTALHFYTCKIATPIPTYERNRKSERSANIMRSSQALYNVSYTKKDRKRIKKEVSIGKKYFPIFKTLTIICSLIAIISYYISH